MKTVVKTKVCSKCKRNKVLSDFYKHKGHIDGLSSECKICRNKVLVKYRETNSELIRLADINYRKNNAEKIKIKITKWCKKNPDKVQLIKRRYRVKHYARSLLQEKRYREKRRLKIQNRINANISSKISTALKGSKAGRHWETVVGYTLSELMKHLESKFLPGMSWDNYGKYGWHIDHIIPKDFFIFKTDKDVEFQYCWSLDNLQPLWAYDNLSKSSKVVKGTK